MIVAPDSGAVYLLLQLLDAVETWAHLYVADHWPTRATTLSDLQEASWSGYVPVKVGPWAPPLIVDAQAQSTADPVEWVRGATGDAEQVYGYYLTAGVSGPLLWAEHVCGRESVPMESDGDVCVVWPLVRLTYQPGEPCIQSGGVEIGGF